MRHRAERALRRYRDAYRTDEGNPDFSVTDYQKKLIALRERYKAEARKFSRDILLTKRLAFRTAQDCATATPPIELAVIPERNCHEIQ